MSDEKYQTCLHIATRLLELAPAEWCKFTIELTPLEQTSLSILSNLALVEMRLSLTIRYPEFALEEHCFADLPTPEAVTSIVRRVVKDWWDRHAQDTGKAAITDPLVMLIVDVDTEWRISEDGLQLRSVLGNKHRHSWPWYTPEAKFAAYN